MYGELYDVANGNNMYGSSEMGRDDAGIKKALLRRAFLKCG